MKERLRSLWTATGVVLLSLLSSTALGRTASASFAEFDARARAGEKLSVVYFGASLMFSANASDPSTTGFRGLMSDYLEKRYPKAHFKFHDAAIGGTPSKLGLFRLNRDVLSKKPDLVFLDFVCNDGGDNVNPDNTCAYEQILRELIMRGVAVEQVFFTFKWWMDANPYEKGVPRQRLYRNLAEVYGTPYSDTHKLIKAKIDAKETMVDFIWPIDGGHPGDYGYKLFFQAAKESFEKAVANKMVCRVPVEPVYGSVADVCRVPLADLGGAHPEGWSSDNSFRTSMWYDGLSSRWLGETVTRLDANAQAASFSAKGNYIAFFGEADGKTALPLEVSIDGGPAGVLGFSHGCDGRLMVFRDLFIGEWMTGVGTKHVYAIKPHKDEKKPNGEVRIESVMAGTFKPTPLAIEIFQSFGRKDFNLDAIDHARGSK